jgi:hypothetical protein
MVLDKFGPPIVRTTRGMIQDNKTVFNNTAAQKSFRITKENLGFMNRPLVLVESLENDI